MTQLHTFVFNPFQENTYLLADETGECIIVDPGCYFEEEKYTLFNFIQKNNYRLTKIVNTHCHVDHILGSAFLSSKFNVSFEANKEDEFLLQNAVEHGKMFGFDVEPPPAISKYLAENEDLVFGSTILKVLHVPGHSPGSIALYCKAQKFVITGDVLFSGSIGRTDLPGGDYNALINSIKNKLLSLPDDVIVYAGHGPSTTIGHERRTNPFLND